MRQLDDFRFRFGDHVTYNGTGGYEMPAGTPGTIVRLVMTGPYPYRVVFDLPKATGHYGYMMLESEIEADDEGH